MMNNTIKLRGIVMEDFINYKYPSIFLITSYCDFKCCTEAGLDFSLCQNNSLVQNDIKEFTYEAIYDAYMNNDITEAVVIGGLEPFLQFDELQNLISYFRSHNCIDDFVIYTGYCENEIKAQINFLKKYYTNIVIKFGRFIPNQKLHYDPVLGVNLVSDNQYGVRVS